MNYETSSYDSSSSSTNGVRHAIHEAEAEVLAALGITSEQADAVWNLASTL